MKKMLRKINYWLIKNYEIGFKRNYPFRTSTKFVSNYFKRPIVVIEIGTHKGESAEYLLQKVKNTKEIYLIDPYEEDRWEHDKSKNNFIEAKKRVDKFKDVKSIFIKKTSDEAVKDFKEKSIDYIYIDGLHTYPQVKKDINNYFPLLKDDGVIAGHDIQRPEVTKAILEFCCKNNLLFFIREMDWIICKKQIDGIEFRRIYYNKNYKTWEERYGNKEEKTEDESYN